MAFLTPGETLKKLRKILNITQEQLSEAGISRNFISMFEGNKRKLNKNTAEKIIDILKTVADNQGIDIDSELKYLYMSREAAAELYCKGKLSISQEDLSLEEMNEIITISKEYNFYDKLYTAYFIKANIFYDSCDYKSAFDCYHDALETVLRYLDQDTLCTIYNKLGKCRLKLSDYEEALYFFDKAYKFSKVVDKIECLKFSLFNMALTQKKLGYLDIAIEKVDEYLSIDDKIDNHNEAVLLKANCLLEKEDFPMALELYFALERSFSDTMHPLLGYIYNNIAVAYTNLNNFSEALVYFKKAEDIRIRVDHKSIAHIYIEKSEVFIKQNLYDQAIELLEKSISNAKKYNDMICIIEAYGQLEEIYGKYNNQNKLEDLYMKLSEVFDYLGSKEELTKVYIKLSLLNMKRNRLELAIEYAEKAINS